MSPKRPSRSAASLDPSPEPSFQEPVPMSEPVPPMPAPAPTPMMPQGHWRAASDPKETVRKVGLALALLFLAVSLAIAYYSANSILAIWFEYQYTPIVRLVLALGVAGLCVWIVMRLTQKRA